MTLRLHGRSAALALVVLLTAFALGYFGTAPILALWQTADAQPQEGAKANKDLVLVYIGSSRCRPSNAPEMPKMIRDLVQKAERRAQENGLGFTTLGIARDNDPQAGFAHLQKSARFDEIITGRGWLNLGLWRYVYDEVPGLAATPQVLITLRDVDVSKAGAAITAERLLLRKVGSSEIASAIAGDLGLPAFRSHSSPK